MQRRNGAGAEPLLWARRGETNPLLGALGWDFSRTGVWSPGKGGRMLCTHPTHLAPCHRPELP